MKSIQFLCRFFWVARMVAVTIKKNNEIVKRRLFALYFGITFTSFTFSASGCWLLVTGSMGGRKARPYEIVCPSKI